MRSFNCSSSLETQVLLCNICPYRLLVQVFRGAFQREGLVFICFSCLRDILSSMAEANAACYRLFLHNQAVIISVRLRVDRHLSSQTLSKNKPNGVKKAKL